MGNDRGFGTCFDTDCLSVWTEIQSFNHYCILWQYQLNMEFQDLVYKSKISNVQSKDGRVKREIFKME